MPSRMFLIIRVSIMLAVVALAVIGTIYVLDLVKGEQAREALGKIFALLGIYTGSALALTLLANSRQPAPAGEQPHP